MLGAGGVMGGAWLTGALEALASETGWDPASAEYIVGTSAGSMLAALLAAGIPPWFMIAHSAGESFDGLTDADGRPAAHADRAGGAVFKLHMGIPCPGPGSPELIVRSLAAPRRHRPAALAAGWVPRGIVSTEPLKDVVRRVVPSGWAEHRNLWVVACDYTTGRRVAFGREGSPQADLADAVAASCAIPGFYRPVRIEGRPYVDGGLWSTSNLDILRDCGLDLVICLNPTSSLHPTHAWNITERLASYSRSISGRRLGSEAKTLRSRGAAVVLVQPTDEDVAAMGPNLMARTGRNRVIETAVETVRSQLRQTAVRELLADLPEGEPHKVARPAGPPSEWPDTLTNRERRAAAS